MARSRELWVGPAGAVEVLLDRPSGTERGVALLAHPHPLLGGTPEHKVPAFLASQLCDDGWVVARPSFRGVGASDGEHDFGHGEAEDLCAVASECERRLGTSRLVLVGYSFGAFVQARVWRALSLAGQTLAPPILIASGVGEVAGGRTYELGPLPDSTFVVHGELDEQVPLSNVLRWAGPLDIVVAVVPGADHSFSRRLAVLGRTVVHGAAALYRSR